MSAVPLSYIWRQTFSDVLVRRMLLSYIRIGGLHFIEGNWHILVSVQTHLMAAIVVEALLISSK